MTDPIDRRQPATCRLPGDGSDDDDREAENAVGKSDVGYADAGYSRGGHAVFAGAAVVKGRDPSGLELDALSVSVQVGGETEAQATAARAGFSGKYGAVSAEAGTANAHVGIHNPDGSTGLNVGAGVVAASAEVTFSDQANHVTLGIGEGLGAEGSIGIRDKDGNGRPEICLRVGVEFVTFGTCIELPFHGKM